MTTYQQMRTRDIVGGMLLITAVMTVFSFLPERAAGSDSRDWVYDMVEHAHWSVGRVVATCDGANRVYIVRGDTGVALTVVPGGCDGAQ